MMIYCKFIYDDVKISTLNCRQRNETTTDGALMISLKLSMKCWCFTNSGKKGATKTLSPHMSLYQFLFNLTEPCKTRSHLTNWMNWLNWFLARCSWGAPSWMWARKPLPRPILLWGPFPLACLRWSSWWALHWQNWTVIKNGLKHMFSSEFSSLTRQKTVKTKVLHWE